jgi:hypothetical protein
LSVWIVGIGLDAELSSPDLDKIAAQLQVAGIEVKMDPQSLLDDSAARTTL